MLVITKKMRNLNLEIVNKQILQSGGQCTLLLPKTWHSGVPTFTNTKLCKYCGGRYRRDKLWFHLKHSCSEFKAQSIGQTKIQAVRVYSTASALVEVSDHLKNEVLPAMNQDETWRRAISDNLIMNYISEFHMSRRESRHQVSSEMRLLSRLLKVVNDKLSTNEQSGTKTMSNISNPMYFNTIVQAVLDISGCNDETGLLGKPSIPYRVLPALKSILELARSQTISKVYEGEGNDRETILMYDDFATLLEKRWSSKIGRLAVKSKKKS